MTDFKIGLKDVEDENGKVKPRLLDIESEKVQAVFDYNMHYITDNDYDNTREFIPNPEGYDFRRILNW